MKKKTVRILNIILIALFIVSAFNIGKIYYDYGKADNTYNEMQNEYISVDDENPCIETMQDSCEQTEQTTESYITVDFDTLLNKNKDVIGWLYCPDTDINYPVVQGENNNQYLRKDLDGRYLVSGTLFADYRNGALSEDANYIIYGHNMKNGTMFGSLVKYKQQAYYDQYPVMYYLTPDGNYKLELFAGLVVKCDDKIYQPNQSNEDFAELIEEYRSKSTFKSDVISESNDIIVTLSTCSYEFDDARYIVIGRLISY